MKSKSKEFIINNLNYLCNKFDNISIRCEYRTNTNCYVIQILPKSLYEHNIKYMETEFEIENKFESKFPDENILFITEGSLIEVKNPELQLGNIK